jgi:TetR/AcrR family transcriptional regulator of autoinduction and epiphytic fitness
VATRATKSTPRREATELEVPSDGRTARAVRTRAAIVDALLDLLHEGDLQPTATRIAERAGISLRLIYHHFGDLESLFREASAREAERLATMVEPIASRQPLVDRVEQIVAQRAFVLEWISPVRRASLLQEPFSEELRAARDALTEIGREQVVGLFHPELDGLDADERLIVVAALSGVLSWGLWNDLREGGCTQDQARTVVARLVADLLPGSNPSR